MILTIERNWLQDDSLIVKEKMMKENSNFQLSKIISGAQPASSSKWKKSCWFRCIILCQQKQSKINVRSKTSMTSFSYHIIRKYNATYFPSFRLEFQWIFIYFRIQVNAPEPGQNSPSLGNDIT